MGRGVEYYPASGVPVTVVSTPPATGAKGTLRYDDKRSLLLVAQAIDTYQPVVPPVRRRKWGYMYALRDGANTLAGDGCFNLPTLTTGSIGRYVLASWGRHLLLTTGSTINDTAAFGAGIGTTNDCVMNLTRRPWVMMQIAIDAVVTTMRCFLGWVVGDPDVAAQGSGTEPTGICMGLNYDPATDANWTLLTRGATGFVRTSFDAPFAPVADAVYNVLLRMLSTGTVQCEIFNATTNTLICTASVAASGNVPVLEKEVNWMNFVKTLVGAQRGVRIFHIETDTEI